MKRRRGHRLRVLRADKSLNQYDTARKLGMGRDRYWRIENGYQDPTPEEVEALEKLFNVTADEIGFAKFRKAPAAESAV